MAVSFNTDVDYTVEVAFGTAPLATTFTWTDVSAYVRGFTVTRGRSNIVGEIQAGTATVTFDNRDGRFDPNNTTGAYYPDVIVMVPIRIRAQASPSPVRDLFVGFVESWPPSYPTFGKDAVVSVAAADGFKILNLGKYPTDETVASESTDTRITRILDDAGWRAGSRNLDTGVGYVHGETIPAGTPYLSELRDTAAAEAGVLFVARNGDVTFHKRTHLSGTPTPVVTFGNGAGETPIRDLVVSFDDDYLWNTVEVTGSATGATPQSATDSTSVTSYGPRELSRSGLPVIDDNQALNVAEFELARWKDVALRIKSLTFLPVNDATNWDSFLALELRDAVDVNWQPPGGGTALAETVAVEHITHTVRTGTANTWTIKLGTSPFTAVDTADYWILGTSTLGTSTVLA